VGAFFAPGKWIGSAFVQGGAAVGLYVVGRCVLPGEGESRTNKVSHLGMDLIRAQLLSQAFVHGIKHTVQRDRPSGECCSFPSGHSASAFAAAIGVATGWTVVGRHGRAAFTVTPVPVRGGMALAFTRGSGGESSRRAR
jgi:hypothetical protein